MQILPQVFIEGGKAEGIVLMDFISYGVGFVLKRSIDSLDVSVQARTCI